MHRKPSLKHLEPFVSRAITLFLFFALILLFISYYAHAQTTEQKPYMLLTWSTDTYVPAWYRGRALPIANSPVRVALDVIDGGKLVDLSRYTIRWYLGEIPHTGGTGLDTITVRVPDVTGTGILKVRAQINDYKQSTIIKVINIPVVTPEAVISSPISSRAILANSFLVEGIPYFFNVRNMSELSFDWLVNNTPQTGGEEASADSNFLAVAFNKDAAAESVVNVRLSVKNMASSFEAARRNVSFIYMP